MIFNPITQSVNILLPHSEKKKVAERRSAALQSRAVKRSLHGSPRMSLGSKRETDILDQKAVVLGLYDPIKTTYSDHITW